MSSFLLHKFHEFNTEHKEIPPKVYLVIGQTGAGKSSSKNDLIDDCVNQDIDAFKFKEDSIRIAKILKNSMTPEEFQSRTEEYANIIGDQAREYALTHKKNLLIESTGSGSDWWLNKELQRFKDNGYEVHVRIVGVNPLLSGISIFKRYEKEMLTENIGRLVPLKVHNSGVSQTINFLEASLNHNNVDSVSLYNRSGFISETNLENKLNNIHHNISIDDMNFIKKEIEETLILFNNRIINKKNISDSDKKEFKELIEYINDYNNVVIEKNKELTKDKKLSSVNIPENNLELF